VDGVHPTAVAGSSVPSVRRLRPAAYRLQPSPAPPGPSWSVLRGLNIVCCLASTFSGEAASSETRKDSISRSDAGTLGREGKNVRRKEGKNTAATGIPRFCLPAFSPSVPPCVTASLRESIFCLIFGFYETYRHPEASTIRQGTAATVPVESQAILDVLRSFLGLLPKPWCFVSTIRYGVGNEATEVTENTEKSDDAEGRTLGIPFVFSLCGLCALCGKTAISALQRLIDLLRLTPTADRISPAGMRLCETKPIRDRGRARVSALWIRDYDRSGTQTNSKETKPISTASGVPFLIRELGSFRTIAPTVRASSCPGGNWVRLCGGVAFGGEAAKMAGRCGLCYVPF
jgi:hypothetical protein